MTKSKCCGAEHPKCDGCNEPITGSVHIQQSGNLFCETCRDRRLAELEIGCSVAAGDVDWKPDPKPEVDEKQRNKADNDWADRCAKDHSVTKQEETFYACLLRAALAEGRRRQAAETAQREEAAAREMAEVILEQNPPFLDPTLIPATVDLYMKDWKQRKSQEAK